VMTTATEKPEQTGSQYREVFSRLGLECIDVLHINTREEANSSSLADVIDRASGIFFTGGDQLRITSILGGSIIGQALQSAYLRGVVIAGTSAGASAMSDTMIVEGDSSSSPKRCTLKMAPGLGLIKETVIDQHFAQRGRIGRLLCAVAQNPYVLGIGIDEDSAIIVRENGLFEVIGSQTVTVVDGKTIRYSNVSESDPDQPLSLTNVTVHILSKGYEFDLTKRQSIKDQINL
jgi:cyanophycinase